MKARRFRYVEWGVISDEGMGLESDLRISIVALLSVGLTIRLSRCPSGYKIGIFGTQESGKSENQSTDRPLLTN